jgi:sec-independent protein translocase protein TatA
MGLGGISVWQLLIILVIVVLLFGTKRLKSLGSDLGSAVKGFKKSVSDDEQTTAISDNTEQKQDAEFKDKPKQEAPKD